MYRKHCHNLVGGILHLYISNIVFTEYHSTNDHLPCLSFASILGLHIGFMQEIILML